ncbi:MAG: 16S rRNA (cytosine(967)-C(5))-methyltransferase RsmB [Firmicutes bacterium]|nr:16S rRNA (cytosine(967)-C(5))-methyltransferase RsmB [Bacillota bacterium]
MQTKSNKPGVSLAREKALQALVQVERDKAFINLTLKRHLGYFLNREDRAFATRLSYGVIQRLNTLDWIISLYLKKELSTLTSWIRNILRLSAYQLFYMVRVPTHAIVNESVKLSYRYGHRGVAGLVNAVLRKMSRAMWEELPWPDKEKEPLNFLCLRYSFPLWLIRRWLKQHSFAEVEQICKAHNRIPPVFIRANTLKTTAADLERFLTEEGAVVEKHPFLPEVLQLVQSPLPLDSLVAYKEGLFHVQGDSSILTCLALKPCENDKLLDLCCAPGGKTATLSQMMKGKGTIVAVEPDANRMKLLQNTLHRLQIKNVSFVLEDGRNISEKKWGSFSKVLVDAPCSGVGVIRRKPDIKWRLNESIFKENALLQLSLLQKGFSMLSPGGLLVYSVCSTDFEETVSVIRAFLKENKNACLAKLALLSQIIKPREEGLYLIQPHLHDMDGFFISGLVKKA